jgi:hypothetical protein
MKPYLNGEYSALMISSQKVATPSVSLEMLIFLHKSEID